LYGKGYLRLRLFHEEQGETQSEVVREKKSRLRGKGERLLQEK
jgi:hypothetical protein